MMSKLANTRGFTLTELLMSMTITMIITGSALQTFRNALVVNDSAAQLADANQNLRAGTNQLIKDIMQAGRVIGPEGIPIPSGTGTSAIKRPGPPGTTLTFDVTTTTNLPDITTGYQLGPRVNGTPTDVITIMTVDPFMSVLELPAQGTLDLEGSQIILPATSLWLTGDGPDDTPPIVVGDLVLFKNANGMAVQTVTKVDSTHVFFEAADWFNFNQRGTAIQGNITQINGGYTCLPGGTSQCAWPGTSVFRLLMITYYVDKSTAEGIPRLMRKINNFDAQALAGVVEDLDLTYDLVDGVNNPTEKTTLPFTDNVLNVTYNSNQIRKVNIHMGVRSETISYPTQDYIRNHTSTSVDVRSLASVDRYVTH